MNDSEKLLWALVTVLLIIIIIMCMKKENFNPRKPADVAHVDALAKSKGIKCGGDCSFQHYPHCDGECPNSPLTCNQVAVPTPGGPVHTCGCI